MWIIEYLPEIVVHIIFIVGVLGVIAGFLLGFIPAIKPYKLAIQIVALIVLSLGIYLEGGLEESRLWKARVAELEIKVKESETKSAEVNTVFQDRVVTQTKIVKERADAVIKYVDRWNTKEVIKEVEGPERIKREEVVKFVERCSLPQDVVDTHNRAVEELNKAASEKKK